MLGCVLQKFDDAKDGLHACMAKAEAAAGADSEAACLRAALDGCAKATKGGAPTLVRFRVGGGCLSNVFRPRDRTRGRHPCTNSHDHANNNSKKQEQDPVAWIGCEGSGAAPPLLYLDKEDQGHVRLATALGEGKSQVCRGTMEG